MHGELPVCKRCCICLPLRYGLITWGYLKLIATSFIVLNLSFALYYRIKIRRLDGNENLYNNLKSEIVPVSIGLVVYVADIVLTTVTIVGGHKKNVKLLRMVFFCGIALWILTTLMCGVTLGLSTHSWLADKLTSRLLEIILIDLIVYFANIALEIYFLLLLRSEIIKLRNNCVFRFVNNATESKCTMKCDEEIADGETEDV